MQITCTCGEKYWPSQKWIHEKCVSHTASNTMANEATNNVANEASESNTYKYRDPEKRRAYQREYMRKRREDK
jgi:hypothetical protein